MVKVITERPAKPISESESVSGVDDGDDGNDWEPDTTNGIPPGVDPGDVLTWDGDSWEPEAPAAGTREWELWNEGGDPMDHAIGSMGSSVTIDPTDGNHQTGTVDDDCTVTLDPPSGDVAILSLRLTNDGDGHVITFSGSVTEIGTRVTGDGLSQLAVALTDDGGTSWVVAWIGGSAPVVSLDDLSDVTITTPATGHKLRYDGSGWVNANLHDEPMIASDGSVQTDGLLNPQMHEVAW